MTTTIERLPAVVCRANRLGVVGGTAIGYRRQCAGSCRRRSDEGMIGRPAYRPLAYKDLDRAPIAALPAQPSVASPASRGTRRKFGEEEVPVPFRIPHEARPAPDCGEFNSKVRVQGSGFRVPDSR